jgi:Copper transport outer membrane protein, MctB
LISFRYHLVTIVAVFLALGLGVLAGTTVLDQGLVSNLKERTRAAEHETARVSRELSAIRDQAGQLRDLLQQATPLLIEGRLTGNGVVVVTYDGSDQAARNEAVNALQQSGADVVAILAVTGKMAAVDPSSRSELASLLGLPSADAEAPTPKANSSPRALVRQAAQSLADRLAVGARPGGLPPTKGGVDLLSGLLDKGFLKSSVAPGEIPEVGGPDQVVLVVTGGDRPPPVPVSGFMVPLVEELDAHPAVWVAVGQSFGRSPEPLVPLVRRDSSLAGDRMVTIDDLDPEHFGGVQLVLALETLVEQARGGDYGIGPDSQGVLPKAG